MGIEPIWFSRCKRDDHPMQSHPPYWQSWRVLPPLSHAWQACESAVPLHDYVIGSFYYGHVTSVPYTTRNLYYSLVAKDFTRVMCQYQPQLVLWGLPLRLSKFFARIFKNLLIRSDINWGGENLLASTFIPPKLFYLFLSLSYINII